MDKRTIYISVLLATALILLGCSTANKKVSNFDECVEAEGTIEETYPEKCTYNDKTYVKVSVSEEPKSTTTETSDGKVSPENELLPTEDIEMTGTVADLGELFCKCFTFKTEKGDYNVRYSDFLPEQSNDGPVDVSHIKNGDTVKIIGKLEISEKSSVRNVMLKKITKT